MDKYNSDNQNQLLFEALAGLENAGEVQQFLTDLCTPQEISAFAERWQIARILDQGKHSYREISAITGASTTTVSRVAKFLQNEPYQGYKLILERQKSKEK